MKKEHAMLFTIHSLQLHNLRKIYIDLGYYSIAHKVSQERVHLRSPELVKNISADEYFLSGRAF